LQVSDIKIKYSVKVKDYFKTKKYFEMFLKLKPFFSKMFARKKIMRIFATANAQMAESVDALVSNTSGATHPGSTPGLSTKKDLLITSD
jgi:hypothetical protein